MSSVALAETPILLQSQIEVLENARLAVEYDPVRLAMESETSQQSRRLWKALMLAPTLEVFEALVSGEDVPLDRLDPEWVKRFGIR